MSEDHLTIDGALEETTVPDLFRSFVRSGETGIVSLQAGSRNDSIYFEEGRIVYAASSDPDMGLAETLLRSGDLNLHEYETAMSRLVVSHRIGALLCELGYLRPEELSRAIEKQVRGIIVTALARRSGSYTIEFNAEFPAEIIKLNLPTERLMIDGVRQIEHWSLIWRGLARLDRMLEAVPGADMKAYSLELGDEDSLILSLLTEPQTIEQICARSYLSNFVTCRTLWGLLAVNFVQDAGGEATSEKRAAIESEYELEGLVERYNGLFQQIFSLVFQRIGDHVYDFVDRVLLHLSPDTMPYLSGMNFVNEARVDFDQLYNNVIASGTQNHMALVQDVLSELLYGWILEIKAEFGAGMEAEVVKLANALKK